MVCNGSEDYDLGCSLVVFSLLRDFILDLIYSRLCCLPIQVFTRSDYNVRHAFTI